MYNHGVALDVIANRCGVWWRFSTKAATVQDYEYCTPSSTICYYSWALFWTTVCRAARWFVYTCMKTKHICQLLFWRCYTFTASNERSLRTITKWTKKTTDTMTFVHERYIKLTTDRSVRYVQQAAMPIIVGWPLLQPCQCMSTYERDSDCYTPTIYAVCDCFRKARCYETLELCLFTFCLPDVFRRFLSPHGNTETKLILFTVCFLFVCVSVTLSPKSTNFWQQVSRTRVFRTWRNLEGW